MIVDDYSMCLIRLARRQSLPGAVDEKGPTGANDFLNAYQDHFEAVSRQVEIGINAVRRVAHLLRKVCVAEQTMVETIKAALENETVKHGDRTQSDAMASVATAWQETQTHISTVNLEHAKRAQRVILEVCNPLEDFFNTQEIKRKALLAKHKSVTAEMWACRQQCVRGQLAATKALWAAKKKKEKEKEESNTSRTLKSSFLQKISEMANMTAEDLQKQAINIVTQYTTDVVQANARQDQMYREEFPQIYAGLESIEVARLGMLKVKLELYSKIYHDSTGPINDVSAAMLADIAKMQPSEDLQTYIQQGYKIHGPPQPPMAYIYGLPVTLKDVKAGRFEGNPDSVFHNTLEAVMDTQRDKYPELTVPRILVTLIDAIKDLKGLQVEGIFRVSAGKKQLDDLHDQFDNGDYSIPSGSSPHLPACLLKEWLRELPEPLISETLYAEAIAIGSDPKSKPAAALSVFNRLDPHPRNVIKYIAWLAQDICAPENLELNRMSMENLAIIFSPSFIRNPADDPMQMMLSIKFETRFIMLLFQSIPSTGKPAHTVQNSHAVFTSSSTSSSLNNVSLRDSGSGILNLISTGSVPPPVPPTRLHSQNSQHSLVTQPSQQPPAYVPPAPLNIAASAGGVRPVSPRVNSLPPGVVSSRPLSPPVSRESVHPASTSNVSSSSNLFGAGHHTTSHSFGAPAQKPPPPPAVKPESARKSARVTGVDSEDENE